MTRDWLRNTTFWVFIVANTFQGFGYFVPTLWLPSEQSSFNNENATLQRLKLSLKAFASALNLSSANAAIALSMLNGASAAGRLILGHLSDKLNPWLLAFSTLVFTSLSTFILWGILSTNFAGLLAFGIIYGALAGGWSCLWAGFVRPLASDDPTLVTTLLGYLMLSRGIGNIFSTPISSALSSGGLESNSTSVPYHPPRTGFQVDNGKYEKMILYVGTCYAGAAACVEEMVFPGYRVRLSNVLFLNNAASFFLLIAAWTGMLTGGLEKSFEGVAIERSVQ
ncbi:hypothetical protein PQX77_016501 [Marasmius sp. AFHP31]|nr:hypothetical protein PQX77_016501 [Marasmius sp. AFHP31]